MRAVLIISLLALINLAHSLHIPDEFDDKVLNVKHHSEQYINSLGTIIKLNTTLQPSSIDAIQTKFKIFNREKRENVTDFVFKTSNFIEQNNKSYPFDLLQLVATGFDANKRTIIMTHGYLVTEPVEWINAAKDLWLELEDVNVISVTWISATKLGIYTYDGTVANAPLIARQTTILLHYLAEMKGYKLTDPEFSRRIHFIAHSLGAHIAGYVGQDFSGKIGRITGLDPAGPYFDLMQRDNRLDISDAMLVDVIHTNSGKLRSTKALISTMQEMVDYMRQFKNAANRDVDSAWFGIDKQVGHVDYYANDGRLQPGCTDRLHACDHSRSHAIYRDILKFEIDRRKSSLSQQQLKQNRLLAFNSIDYQSFLIGDNFNLYCPSLLTGREYLQEDIDETFKSCSIPIDLVTPVEELMRELSSDYSVDFDNQINYQTSQRYFFKTRSDSPLVGDHYLLKVTLDKSSYWDNSCSLEAIITLKNGANSTTQLNKQLQLVKNERFYGLTMPFINLVEYEARKTLQTLLEISPSNHTDPYTQTLIKKVLPESLHLAFSGPYACYLAISSVKIEPVASFKQKVIGFYKTSEDEDLPPTYYPIKPPGNYDVFNKETDFIRGLENTKLLKELSFVIFG